MQTFSLPKTNNAANPGCAMFSETANQSLMPQKSYTELTIVAFLAQPSGKKQQDNDRSRYFFQNLRYFRFFPPGCIIEEFSVTMES